MASKLRGKLIDKLAALGVEDRPLAGRDDGFSSLFYRGRDFAHFHNDNELDIRLGKSIIEREGLTHPPNSVRHPHRSKKSPWIEVRFTTAVDVERVIGLIEMAIANMK